MIKIEDGEFIEACFARHRKAVNARTSRDWNAKEWEACRALTERGIFRQILTPPQRKFYDAIKNKEDKEFGLFSTRKLGKSFTNLVLAYEFAINNPNAIILLVLPQKDQARNVVFPMFNEMEQYVSPRVAPRLLRSDARIEFQNGAVIKLGGALPENIESLRGPACHLLILDEVAFFDANNFNNALYSVIKPQLTITGGKTLYTTTPPLQVDHPFLSDIYPRLASRHNWLTFDVFDNPFIPESRIHEIIEECGGFYSKTFQREYMAQVIADDSIRVTPEFDETKHVVESLSTTDHFGNETDFFVMQVADLGLVDFTGILTGVYDHNRQKLVIIEENMFNSADPSFCLEMVAAEWNEQLWSNVAKYSPNSKPICRVDAFEQVAWELKRTYGMEFQRPKKMKVEENIAFLRNCFELDKIEILKDKCPQLIWQLDKGVWNDKRSDFVRTQAAGHLDLLMCLAYMVHAVPWNQRPGSNNMNNELQKIGMKFNSGRVNKKSDGKLKWGKLDV